MNKTYFLALLVLGGVLLLANSASAIPVRPRPGPIVVPVDPDPEPIVSAN